MLMERPDAVFKMCRWMEGGIRDQGDTALQNEDVVSQSCKF